MQTEYWIGVAGNRTKNITVWAITTQVWKSGDVVWARFTPLQEWRDAMQLLDCVPPTVKIPSVGYRGFTSGFYYLYD